LQLVRTINTGKKQPAELQNKKACVFVLAFCNTALRVTFQSACANATKVTAFIINLVVPGDTQVS
jgi:hypothetical protein